MRKRRHKKLIERMDGVASENFGEALYFRPFAADDEIINLVATRTGGKRSAVAQKLVHLALQGKQFDFDGEKKQLSKMDWLVKQQKQRVLKEEARDNQIERLEEHARELESILKRIEDNTFYAKVFVTEIYGLTTVCVTFLNQIFTRLVEYFSPVEIEKNNSVDFANRNVLGLVKHSLAELEKIAEHHHLADDKIESEMLYLFTKIDLLKARLLTDPVKAVSEPD